MNTSTINDIARQMRMQKDFAQKLIDLVNDSKDKTEGTTDEERRRLVTYCENIIAMAKTANTLAENIKPKEEPKKEPVKKAKKTKKAEKPAEEDDLSYLD